MIVSTYILAWLLTSLGRAQNSSDPDCCPAVDVDFAELDVPALIAANRVQSGPYDIINCIASERAILDQNLKWVQAFARATLGDVEHGIASKHGFFVIFKSNRNQAFVRKIFQDIADGAAPYTVLTDDGAVRRPALLCAGTESPGIPADVHKFCIHHTNFVSTDHGHINFICPGWYDLPMPPRVCPRVGRLGRLLHNGNWMAQHKIGILIHELAHVYVGLYHPDELAEAYDLQSCLDLSEEDSVKNAQSYAIYAMCE